MPVTIGFTVVLSFLPSLVYKKRLGESHLRSEHLDRATRLLLPLVSTAKLAALLVRFERLQISWSLSLSQLSQHSFIIVAAALLPLLAISVAWKTWIFYFVTVLLTVLVF